MVSNCFHFTYSYWAVDIGIGIRQHEKGKSDLRNTPLDITLLFDYLSANAFFFQKCMIKSIVIVHWIY